MYSQGLVFSNQSNTNALRQAQLRYQQALLRGWLSRRWAALWGRSRQLKTLAEARRTITGRRQMAGVQSVPTRQIRGTEGRSEDFDVDFNPMTEHTEERWTSVFRALAQGVALPPVDLIQAGDTYFVRDGHHRVSVAHALRQDYIEAVVTQWD